MMTCDEINVLSINRGGFGPWLCLIMFLYDPSFLLKVFLVPLFRLMVFASDPCVLPYGVPV